MGLSHYMRQMIWEQSANWYYDTDNNNYSFVNNILIQLHRAGDLKRLFSNHLCKTSYPVFVLFLYYAGNDENNNFVSWEQTLVRMLGISKSIVMFLFYKYILSDMYD